MSLKWVLFILPLNALACVPEIETEIIRLEGLYGPYNVVFEDQYLSLAKGCEIQERYLEAIKALNRSAHVIKINSGLWSTERAYLEVWKEVLYRKWAATAKHQDEVKRAKKGRINVQLRLSDLCRRYREKGEVNKQLLNYINSYYPTGKVLKTIKISGTTPRVIRYSKEHMDECDRSLEPRVVLIN